MKLVKCTKCMMDLGEGVRFCPHCGYDQQQEEQRANALRRNTILRGRYLVGNVIGRAVGAMYTAWRRRCTTA